MSMQSQEQPQAEIVRHRTMAASTIKKITETITGANPININLFLVIIISGIGNLLNLSLGLGWYTITFSIIIIFVLDKIGILTLSNKEEVIVRHENPNEFNE